MSFERFRDFSVARLLGKQLERLSLGVSRSAKTGKTLEESGNPFGVTLPYGMGEVVEFDPQKTTHLAQVFDGPPGRRRAEFTVSCIDVGALLD